MRNTFIARGVVATVLFGAALLYVLTGRGFFRGNSPVMSGDNVPPGSVVHDVRPEKTYTNESFGFSFRYPENYVLEDRGNIGTGHRGHHVIILTDSAVGAVPEDSEGLVPSAAEGPPAITIDIFQNLEAYDALTWVKGSNDSNYKLGDGTHEAANVDGVPAIAYRASGLYESNNVVFTEGDAIYKFSVTWLTVEDKIRNDYAGILDTVQVE
jgi:hypothetical protein